MASHVTSEEAVECTLAENDNPESDFESSDLFNDNHMYHLTEQLLSNRET